MTQDKTSVYYRVLRRPDNDPSWLICHPEKSTKEEAEVLMAEWKKARPEVKEWLIIKETIRTVWEAA